MTNWLEIGLSNALLATGLALVVWIVTRFWRHPKVAFALWLLVLVKLLTPPLWGIPWQGWRVAELVDAPIGEVIDEPLPAAVVPPSEIETSSPAAAAPASDATPRPSSPQIATTSSPRPAAAPLGRAATPPAARVAGGGWQLPSPGSVLSAAWITGSVMWLLLALVRIVRFRRALDRARLADSALRVEVAVVAERMGLRRAPLVRLVEARLPPLVWSLLSRPTVVLPSVLVARLSQTELATLVAHELAHLRRRDHLVRLLEMAALCVYWWHPVAWFARRQIERAGEECCDAAVIAHFPKLAGAYAGAMLATVDFLADARPALPEGISGISQVPQLRRRLEMILKGTQLRRVSWPLRIALAALALAVLPWSVQSVAAAPKEFVPRRGSIEQRLDRLEKAMQELTREIRAMREADVANSRPTVIKTVPENGAQNVDPNLKEIKVTFSKDMENGTWSWTGGGETFPQTTGKPRYLKDKRTCVLPVKLEPGKTYSIGINYGRFLNFKDTHGASSVPFPLTFKTR